MATDVVAETAELYVALNEKTANIVRKKPLKMTEEEKAKRSLQTLQSSADQDEELVGKHRNAEPKDLLSSPVVNCKNGVIVYEDKTGNNEVNESDDVGKQLTSDDVPDSYWRDLAEERRLALEDSLTENEELHKEISELKDENSRLSAVADKAEYLSSILQELLDDDDTNNSPPPSPIVASTPKFTNIKPAHKTLDKMESPPVIPPNTDATPKIADSSLNTDDIKHESSNCAATND